jgi:hypothetical protein
MAVTTTRRIGEKNEIDRRDFLARPARRNVMLRALERAGNHQMWIAA